MGMTDKQFDAYNRQLLDRIKDALSKLPENEENNETKAELEKLAETLQKSLEGQMIKNQIISLECVKSI